MALSRSLSFSIAALALSGVAFAESHASPPAADSHKDALPNTYQFGTAFEVVDTSDAANCRLQCDTDVRCDAWSYLPATVNGPERCEVKFSVGKSTYYPGAVSGISARYRVTPIDMTAENELSGGTNALPSQPTAKRDTWAIDLFQDPGPAPRIYRGNELAGPANILTPPEDGETSPLLPTLRRD
ncbi:MAG: hypothetical protein AAFO63_12775 [Pseudomonadota bacterium]